MEILAIVTVYAVVFGVGVLVREMFERLRRQQVTVLPANVRYSVDTCEVTADRRVALRFSSVDRTRIYFELSADDALTIGRSLIRASEAIGRNSVS